MSPVKTFRGQCGRTAVVSKSNGQFASDLGYVVKFASVNGAMSMWDTRTFPRSDFASMEEALQEAVETAKEFAEGSPTNIEQVAYLMNYSEAGPLIQAFVMQGLETYADAVIKGGAEKCDSPMVSGAAWVRCAQDVKAKLS